jgi:hypothetical protein
MRFALGALLLLLSSAANALNCNVECPKGYLGLCVEVDGECSCRCAKDASSGVEAITDLLRKKGASGNAIQRAVQAYREMVTLGLVEFSFKITDNGQTFTVVSSGLVNPKIQ